MFIVIGGGVRVFFNENEDDGALHNIATNSLSIDSASGDIKIASPISQQVVIHDGLAAQHAKKPVNSAYYLSSIIYTDPKNWAIWVNEQRLTQDMAANLSHISIVRVTPEYVECELTAQHTVRLKCHHTLNLANGAVYHGDYREALEDDFDNDPLT